MLKAEQLAAVLSHTTAQFLVIKTNALGGSVVTRVHPLTGGHLLYTGGAIASYTLFDGKTGFVVQSGVAVSAPPATKAHY